MPTCLLHPLCPSTCLTLRRAFGQIICFQLRLSNLIPEPHQKYCKHPAMLRMSVNMAGAECTSCGPTIQGTKLSASVSLPKAGAQLIGFFFFPVEGRTQDVSHSRLDTYRPCRPIAEEVSQTVASEVTSETAALCYHM